MLYTVDELPSILGCEDTVDIAYFCGLHTKVTENLTQLCCEWEEKSNKLEQEYGSDSNSEEGINMEDGRRIKHAGEE